MAASRSRVADRRRERQRRLERRDRLRRSFGATGPREPLARFQLASRVAALALERQHDVPRVCGVGGRPAFEDPGDAGPHLGLRHPVFQLREQMRGLLQAAATPRRSVRGPAARCRASAAIAPGRPRAGRAGSDRPRRDRSASAASIRPCCSWMCAIDVRWNDRWIGSRWMRAISSLSTRQSSARSRSPIAR